MASPQPCAAWEAGVNDEWPAPDRRTETSLQRDIDRSIDYRREYYKYAIGIASALLAFTVSFPPQLTRAPDCSWIMMVGWLALGFAIVAGVRAHMVWAKFFITFRNHDNRGDREGGATRRRWLTRERRIEDIILIVGFSVGVVCVVIFTAINLDHVAVKTPPPISTPAAVDDPVPTPAAGTPQ